MVSMSCYKVRASLASNPYGPCLFLITSESSNTNVDGIKFIGPNSGRQMFLLVDLRVNWMGKLRF